MPPKKKKITPTKVAKKTKKDPDTKKESVPSISVLSFKNCTPKAKVVECDLKKW
jgi:hypothetical protein